MPAWLSPTHHDTQPGSAIHAAAFVRTTTSVPSPRPFFARPIPRGGSGGINGSGPLTICSTVCPCCPRSCRLYANASAASARESKWPMTRSGAAKFKFSPSFSALCAKPPGSCCSVSTEKASHFPFPSSALALHATPERFGSRLGLMVLIASREPPCFAPRRSSLSLSQSAYEGRARLASSVAGSTDTSGSIGMTKRGSFSVLSFMTMRRWPACHAHSSGVLLPFLLAVSRVLSAPASSSSWTHLAEPLVAAQCSAL
mmetsp:Transcript_9866/g.24774  ORF Transcript_9866/g.24774 Transcript_9866/m.24774 type:complete len:257 (+) Transcript_9866:1146-1916(+)